MTDRPIWQAVPGLDEEAARFFANHAVLAVQYGWEYVAVDRTKDWLDFMVNDVDESGPAVAFGRKLKGGLRLPEMPPHVRFRKVPSGNQGLFELDAHIAACVRAIDRWDREHATEIAEFERLKARLGR